MEVAYIILKFLIVSYSTGTKANVLGIVDSHQTLVYYLLRHRWLLKVVFRPANICIEDRLYQAKFALLEVGILRSELLQKTS